MNLLALFVTSLKGGGRVLMEILAEIFDESAYARFLARRELAPSRHAYAVFLRENEATKARRPRCC